MHLGNGALTPACAAYAGIIAAAGAGLAAAHWRTSAGTVSLPKALAWTALVFIAQMINVPLLPWSSVHFVGGVLLAWILGPSLGLLGMVAVLTAQAALGDGGWMALGANTINMALVPAGLVAAVKACWPQRSAGQDLLLAGAASSLAIMLATALIPLEIAGGRSGSDLRGLADFSRLLFAAHAPLILAEGLLAAGLILWAKLNAFRMGVLGLLLAGAGLWFSSPIPDGLEAATSRSGLAARMAEAPAVTGLGGALAAILAAGLLARAAGVAWRLRTIRAKD